MQKTKIESTVEHFDIRDLRHHYICHTIRLLRNFRSQKWNRCWLYSCEPGGRLVGEEADKHALWLRQTVGALVNVGSDKTQENLFHLVWISGVALTNLGHLMLPSAVIQWIIVPSRIVKVHPFRLLMVNSSIDESLYLCPALKMYIPDNV